MEMAEARTASAEILSQFPLFEGERPETLQWLARVCHFERFARDSVLLHPRRAEDRAFVILHGEVQVRLGLHAEQVLATLGPGQCVGEMSVIEGVPPSATVTTATGCQVLVIEGVVLRKLLDSSQVVPRNLLRMLARRVRKDNLALSHSLEQQAASAQHARLDALTGLLNRRWLDETLPDIVAQHQTQGLPLTLLMIDVDRFKSYNDTYGHLAGDQVLIGVARVLQSSVRNGDQAVRFGGEEFLVVLPNTGAVEGSRIATRLRHAIRRTSISTPQGTCLPSVTVSLGLAESLAVESCESMLARADAALYRAKQTGRNRLVISTQDSPEAACMRIPRLRRERPQL